MFSFLPEEEASWLCMTQQLQNEFLQLCKLCKTFREIGRGNPAMDKQPIQEVGVWNTPGCSMLPK